MKDMKKILYIIAAAALCLTACQKEMSEVQPAGPANQEVATVTVPFTVSIQTSNDAATRADERVNRPVLKNLYIAVFGENGGMLQQFVPATQVRDFSSADYGYTNQAEYVAQLPLYDDECHLHFIGNYDGDVSTLTFDYEKDFMDEMAVAITTTTGTDGHSTITDAPVAFWQKVVLPDGIRSEVNPVTGEIEIAKATKEQLNPIGLVRNYAKITVTAAATADFQILSYALVNVPYQGSVAPYHPTTTFNNLYTQMNTYCAPTAPADKNFVTDLLNSGYIGYMGNNDLIFKGNPGYGSAKHFSDPDNGLYMYERRVPERSGEQTGVIVELKWNDELPESNPNYLLRGKTYFYKIEVLDDKGEYIPICRNVHYNINLTKFTGAGYEVTGGNESAAFDAAFAGPFFGNISSSIETATLTTINDNIHQISVNRMDYFSVQGGDEVDIYFQFWLNKSGDPSTSTANYYKEIQTVPSYDPAIAEGGVSDIELVTDPSDPNNGWMHVKVTLNPKDPNGKTLRSKLRVGGQLSEGGVGSLFRDIVFTVMEVQDFTAETKLTVSEDKTNVTVTIGIPTDLPFTMFPLQIKIESQANNLTTNRADLPVGYGPSAFTGKGSTFYFIKTIQYKDYVDTSTGEYQFTTEFPCTFNNLDTVEDLVVKLNEVNGYFNPTTL